MNKNAYILFITRYEDFHATFSLAAIWICVEIISLCAVVSFHSSLLCFL